MLVLDRGTNDTDGITEKRVMDAIHDFFGKETVTMSDHRLATLKKVDCIYLIANGRVVDLGSYIDLAERNSIFQRVSKHV